MEWTRVGAIRMNICLRIHVCTEVSMHMLFPFSVSSESLEAADTPTEQSTQILVSNSPVKVTREGILGKMADARTRPGHMLDEPGASYSDRK